MKAMSTDELKTMLTGSDGKLTVVNTLPPEHFTKTRIPGSINIPEQNEDFAARVEAAAGSKNQPVVVYCASQQCDSSTRAAEKLDAAGFAMVYDYQDGAQGWQHAGNSLETVA